MLSKKEKLQLIEKLNYLKTADKEMLSDIVDWIKDL